MKPGRELIVCTGLCVMLALPHAAANGPTSPRDMKASSQSEDLLQNQISQLALRQQKILAQMSERIVYIEDQMPKLALRYRTQIERLQRAQSYMKDAGASLENAELEKAFDQQAHFFQEATYVFVEGVNYFRDEKEKKSMPIGTFLDREGDQVRYPKEKKMTLGRKPFFDSDKFKKAPVITHSYKEIEDSDPKQDTYLEVPEQRTPRIFGQKPESEPREKSPGVKEGGVREGGSKARKAPATHPAGTAKVSGTLSQPDKKPSGGLPQGVAETKTADIQDPRNAKVKAGGGGAGAGTGASGGTKEGLKRSGDGTLPDGQDANPPVENQAGELRSTVQNTSGNAQTEGQQAGQAGGGIAGSTIKNTQAGEPSGPMINSAPETLDGGRQSAGKGTGSSGGIMIADESLRAGSGTGQAGMPMPLVFSTDALKAPPGGSDATGGGTGTQGELKPSGSSGTTPAGQTANPAAANQTAKSAGGSGGIMMGNGNLNTGGGMGQVGMPMPLVFSSDALKTPSQGGSEAVGAGTENALQVSSAGGGADKSSGAARGAGNSPQTPLAADSNASIKSGTGLMPSAEQTMAQPENSDTDGATHLRPRKVNIADIKKISDPLKQNNGFEPLPAKMLPSKPESAERLTSDRKTSGDSRGPEYQGKLAATTAGEAAGTGMAEASHAANPEQTGSSGFSAGQHPVAFDQQTERQAREAGSGAAPAAVQGSAQTYKENIAGGPPQAGAVPGETKTATPPEAMRTEQQTPHQQDDMVPEDNNVAAIREWLMQERLLIQELKKFKPVRQLNNPNPPWEFYLLRQRQLLDQIRQIRRRIEFYGKKDEYFIELRKVSKIANRLLDLLNAGEYTEYVIAGTSLDDLLEDIRNSEERVQNKNAQLFSERAVRESTVPENYRAMVDRYFQRLSEN